MKQPNKTKPLDRTTPRALTAKDLQGIIGGASSLSSQAETHVMNNPLYQDSGLAGTNPLYTSATVANNPLYQSAGTEGSNPLHKA